MVEDIVESSDIRKGRYEDFNHKIMGNFTMNKGEDENGCYIF
jgi:hypothetical protein